MRTDRDVLELPIVAVETIVLEAGIKSDVFQCFRVDYFRNTLGQVISIVEQPFLSNFNNTLSRGHGDLRQGEQTS